MMGRGGYEREVDIQSDNVRFAPESRHNRRVRLMSANDPKRTLRGMSLRVLNQAKE